MPPTTPILTQIEDKIYDYIRGMKTGPYHFSWGTVNERDLAKAAFPSALVYVDEEESLDEPDGAWGSAYFNEVSFRIEVIARTEVEYENPVFDINRDLNKALDDLKKVFGTNWSLDLTGDIIMYRGSSREEIRNGDIFIPKKLITRWTVRYETSRTDPTEVSC